MSEVITCKVNIGFIEDKLKEAEGRLERFTECKAHLLASTQAALVDALKGVILYLRECRIDDQINEGD